MSLLGLIHGSYVHGRRSRKLSHYFAALLPPQARILDVGAGDGLFDTYILRQRPDVAIEGIDVAVRPNSHLKVQPFDGSVIPFSDKSFDVVMFVDVLHHTDDPLVLLREAGRVAARFVLIKDHTRNGLLADKRLRFMDWVGNARHGVKLPYNYWPQDQWLNTFSQLNWKIDAWQNSLGLYVWPATYLFDGSLHFISRLQVA